MYEDSLKDKILRVIVNNKVVVISAGIALIAAFIIICVVIRHKGNDSTMVQVTTKNQETTSSFEENIIDDNFGKGQYDNSLLPTIDSNSEEDKLYEKEDPYKERDTEGKGGDIDKDKIDKEINNNKSDSSGISYGIDVSKHQGEINWKEVKASGIDYAMIRVGFRGSADGVIHEDPYAKYNMYNANAAGIYVGVYFASTSINTREAQEEAKWVVDYIKKYSITYPVVYDCEGFNNKSNRMYGSSIVSRTNNALAFMKYIDDAGYTPMMYGSKNVLASYWDMSPIEAAYGKSIWVAQYPNPAYPQTASTSYSGAYSMWQYTESGRVNGISTDVDMNVAYFTHKSVSSAKDPSGAEKGTVPNGATDNSSSTTKSTTKSTTNATTSKATEQTETKEPRPTDESEKEYGTWASVDLDFVKCDDYVTAKELTNLRSYPSTTEGVSSVIHQLTNGEKVKRIGVRNDLEKTWSKLVYEGKVVYAVTRFLVVVDEQNSSAE